MSIGGAVVTACDHCCGPSYFMGRLGSLAWYQCRMCGHEQSQPARDELVAEWDHAEPAYADLEPDQLAPGD